LGGIQNLYRGAVIWEELKAAGPHTEEQVVGLGREAAVLKQAQQIVVLPVDVSADLDRAQAPAPGVRRDV